MAKLILVLVLATLGFTNAVDIIKSRSAYSDIYVAIHNSIPESPELIAQIQGLFTSASGFLFNATNKRAYYKSVTIVVPSSWSKNITNNIVYGDYYAEAHVRIAEANPEYGDDPYTLQPGQCGEQGAYIHLTPKFVLDENGWSREMFGDIGRQLVHEWAHFRYGVFDEYGFQGNRQFPLFYLHEGKILPTSCTKGIRGWVEREDGSDCDIYANGEVGIDCRFFPDEEQHDTASIMYMPYLTTVNQFCDKSGQGKVHNTVAPSKQNTFCDYKSTWEVIASHKDFSGVNGEPDESVKDSKPAFRIVRKAEASDTRTVLVMDTSSSMNGANRLVSLQKAARGFISDLIPDQSSLAMITFDSAARIVKPLTKITSKAVRDDLLKYIPKSAGGYTAIGAALTKAIEALTAGGQSSEGCMVILVTDGEESASPRVADVMARVVQSKVIVNGIAMGAQASQAVEQISLKTGGKSYFISDKSQVSSNQIDAAFFQSISVQADVELQPILVSNKDVSLVKDQTVVKDFLIEKELGKNTAIHIGGDNLGSVEVEITSPSGKKYNRQSTEYNEDISVKKRILFTLPLAERGKWNVTFKSKAAMIVKFQMTSEQLDPKEDPIRAKSWFGSVEVTASPNAPAFVRVFAQVTKGNDAVINATVVAFVERPNAGLVELILRDNGAGADLIKNDGIYTGFFNQFTVQGRYATIVKVVNDGFARIKKGILASPAPMRLKRKTMGSEEPQVVFELNHFKSVKGLPPDVVVPSEPAENFTRDVNAGSFKLTGDLPAQNIDKTPPNRVMDLVAVANLDAKPSISVVLTWTAPGDDLDVGQATSYEIRGARSTEDLTGADVSKSHLFAHSIVPTQSGNIQTVEFILPESLLQKKGDSSAMDIYFSLRAIDKAKNVAPFSNLASVHFGYYAPPCSDPAKGYYPHEDDCTVFYQCVHGIPQKMPCPSELHWNEKINQCDWPCEAKCDRRLKC